MTWWQLSEWESGRGILTPPEQNALKLAANATSKWPTQKHCELAVACVKKLADNGCHTAIEGMQNGSDVVPEESPSLKKGWTT